MALALGVLLWKAFAHISLSPEYFHAHILTRRVSTRWRRTTHPADGAAPSAPGLLPSWHLQALSHHCLLYTSDAADEDSPV